MEDITTIPTHELKADRIASLQDIAVCQLALLHGTKHYSGGSVQRRLDINQKIVDAIDAELARREAMGEGVGE